MKKKYFDAIRQYFQNIARLFTLSQFYASIMQSVSFNENGISTLTKVYVN